MSVKVYERILHLFEAEGINTLFGIPDPNFVHLFLTAEQRGWQVVSPHHEAAAGFMAEAVARMTGQRVRRGRIQFVQQAALVAPSVKYSASIEYATQTDEIIREALRRAM